MFEESRFVILEEILSRLGDNTGMDLKQKSRELADRYNHIVLAGAKACPEKPGAHKLLQALAKTYRLYVSSTTPESALTEIIHFRKWSRYFEGIFGYPHEKSKTLQNIIECEKVKSSEVLIVGDGESDRISALENGCPFIHVSENFQLKELTDLVLAL
jgi:phosphoglycolate phosphatase-like HAD superfamily hydrolase